ncbi:MAG TPA: hypothetical protein VGH87_21870, partial [Polyangiaceae bacterium]
GTAHVTYGSKGGPHARVTVPSLGSEIIVPSDIVSVQLSTQPSPVHVVVGEGAFGSKWISAVER